MSQTDDVRAALEQRALGEREQTVYDLLQRQQPQLEKLLPAAIGAERFTRIVLTELRRKPELLDCSPASLLAAMMLSAQLQLEPGPLGHVYLVPFKHEVTFILGYRGMIELARRSGQLRDIAARTVYEGEGFDYEFGLVDKLRHRPLPPGERGEPTHYYGVARFTNGGKQLQVLYPAEIEARRKRSPAGRQELGPWKTDYDAMARKTVIRAMSAYLPLTSVAARALELDEGAAVLPDLDTDAPMVPGDEPPATDA